MITCLIVKLIHVLTKSHFHFLVKWIIFVLLFNTFYSAEICQYKVRALNFMIFGAQIRPHSPSQKLYIFPLLLRKIENFLPIKGEPYACLIEICLYNIKYVILNIIIIVFKSLSIFRYFFKTTQNSPSWGPSGPSPK